MDRLKDYDNVEFEGEMKKVELESSERSARDDR
jgi:hypothetical protein